MTTPVQGSLALIQNRISEIQSMMGSKSAPVGSGGGVLGNNAAFQQALNGALGTMNGANALPSATGAKFTGGVSTIGAPAAAGVGALASPYTALFNAAGAKHGISPQLLMAVARTESNFNPNAKSSAGAQGLMQFMPATARGLGVNPLDPASAIDGAARMLSGLVKKFGNTDFALAAYNAGPGAVQKYGGIPPYKETQNYVKKINALLTQGVQ